jgi:hypothetical protein
MCQAWAFRLTPVRSVPIVMVVNNVQRPGKFWQTCQCDKVSVLHLIEWNENHRDGLENQVADPCRLIVIIAV